MKVEIVGCKDLDMDGGNGIADAVAQTLVAGSADLIESSYTGFPRRELAEVLTTILWSLEPDHDTAGIAVPDDLHDDTRSVGEILASFCAAIDADALKIVFFDAGADDAEESGHIAMMVRSEYDTRTRLNASGLAAAALNVQGPCGRWVIRPHFRPPNSP